jgi:hypothetical protein
MDGWRRKLDFQLRDSANPSQPFTLFLCIVGWRGRSCSYHFISFRFDITYSLQATQQAEHEKETIKSSNSNGNAGTE